MRYEMMRPRELRKAMDANVPFVLPLGVLEYHGEHLALGLDTLVVVRCLDRLEQRRPDLVILPPFYYGAGSTVVEALERNGTIDVDVDALLSFARSLFRSLLSVGCRNIHAIIHHQTENFVAGMPTDLAFKTAARAVVFEWLRKERGDGWWGRAETADYYAGHAHGDNPFNWIQVHPLMDDKIIAQYDFDHAGIGETSLLMALDPRGVKMEWYDDGPWYTRGAQHATSAYGEKAVKLILDRLDALLFPTQDKS